MDINCLIILKEGGGEENFKFTSGIMIKNVFFKAQVDASWQNLNDSKTLVQEKRIQAGLLFVKMKKLNRLEKLRVRTAR